MKDGYVPGLSKDSESSDEATGRSLLIPILIVMTALTVAYIAFVNYRTTPAMNKAMERDFPAQRVK